MDAALIVIGDRGRTRLFGLEKRKEPMQELGDLVNPEVRMHERELSGDRQGRGMSRNHGSRAALGENHPHKRLSAERFARQVADAVQGCCAQHRYRNIILIAAPEFLGLLRPCLAGKHLAPPLIDIPKDLTRHAVEDIRDHLPENLR
jgi:protein required for attachment to host cells